MRGKGEGRYRTKAVQAVDETVRSVRAYPTDLKINRADRMSVVVSGLMGVGYEV